MASCVERVATNPCLVLFRLIYADSCPATVNLNGASLGGDNTLGQTMTLDLGAAGYTVTSVDWGDSTAPGTDMSHSYAENGTYQVAVMAEDGDGCGGAATVDVTIVNPPEPVITAPAKLTKQHKGAMSGDPHILGWDGETFDFQ